MRNWINLITETQNLNEGVDFYPSVKRIEDGRTIIDYPEGTTRRELVPCKYCEGTGYDYTYEHDPRHPDANEHGNHKVLDPTQPCEPCSPPWGDGKGKTWEWIYDFPSMRVTYMHIRLLTDLLGMEFGDSGWIEPEDLPGVKRRLMMVINRDGDSYAIPATDERKVSVDRSGDVPAIKAGPRMIGAGVSGDSVRDGAQQLLKIVDWAQKHNCGVSWA
jgi:hypothetical protein